MAFLTQVHTQSASNVNLATALLICTFTNTTRIRKVFVNVFADQVAGAGDYICYIKVQRAGAGSAYETIRTTKAAASGVTAVCFQSIAITLNATDVLTAFLLGLAGDTTTPDIVVDVNEELPDTAAIQTIVEDLPTNAELATALGAADDAVLVAIAGAVADTEDIQARLPAALTGDGLMKADVLRIDGDDSTVWKE